MTNAGTSLALPLPALRAARGFEAGGGDSIFCGTREASLLDPGARRARRRPRRRPAGPGFPHPRDERVRGHRHPARLGRSRAADRQGGARGRHAGGHRRSPQRDRLTGRQVLVRLDSARYAVRLALEDGGGRRHAGAPGSARDVPHDDRPDAGRRAGLRGQLGLSRRPPAQERGLRRLHRPDAHRRAAAGVRHAIREACMPTFVSVSPDDRRLYVACNGSDALQVVDAGTLELLRAVPTGHGAYNVEPSPDGRWVIVTNKKDRSVSLFDAATLTEAARIPTSKQLPHGIAYAPDGRFAFVSVESVGADPGAVDVIDLTTHTRVASTPIPLQPTGIAILRRP